MQHAKCYNMWLSLSTLAIIGTIASYEGWFVGSSSLKRDKTKLQNRLLKSSFSD